MVYRAGKPEIGTNTGADRIDKNNGKMIVAERNGVK